MSRELSIDMVIHGGIFKNNQITVSPCFTFIPKTGVRFYCALCLVLVGLVLTLFEP